VRAESANKAPVVSTSHSTEFKSSTSTLTANNRTGMANTQQSNTKSKSKSNTPTPTNYNSHKNFTTSLRDSSNLKLNKENLESINNQDNNNNNNICTNSEVRKNNKSLKNLFKETNAESNYTSITNNNMNNENKFKKPPIKRTFSSKVVTENILQSNYFDREKENHFDTGDYARELEEKLLNASKNDKQIELDSLNKILKTMEHKLNKNTEELETLKMDKRNQAYKIEELAKQLESKTDEQSNTQL